MTLVAVVLNAALTHSFVVSVFSAHSRRESVSTSKRKSAAEVARLVRSTTTSTSTARSEELEKGSSLLRAPFGFENPTATQCFMNSSIQALLSLPPFVNLLNDIKIDKSSPKDKQGRYPTLDQKGNKLPSQISALKEIMYRARKSSINIEHPTRKYPVLSGEFYRKYMLRDFNPFISTVLPDALPDDNTDIPDNRKYFLQNQQQDPAEYDEFVFDSLFRYLDTASPIIGITDSSTSMIGSKPGFFTGVSSSALSKISKIQKVASDALTQKADSLRHGDAKLGESGLAKAKKGDAPVESIKAVVVSEQAGKAALEEIMSSLPAKAKMYAKGLKPFYDLFVFETNDPMYHDAKLDISRSTKLHVNFPSKKKLKELFDKEKPRPVVERCCRRAPPLLSIIDMLRATEVVGWRDDPMQKLVMKSSPKILRIDLTRFPPGGGKNRRNVNIPLKLNLITDTPNLMHPKSENRVVADRARTERAKAIAAKVPGKGKEPKGERMNRKKTSGKFFFRNNRAI